MSKPKADKTQILGPEALRAAQAKTPESTEGQATVMLPAGLPMLEPPPLPGEESTQPLPLTRVDPEAEVRAILEGPDATVRLQVGPPPPPAEDPSATRMLPVGDPALPIATQMMPTGAPAQPDPQDRPRDARTLEIPANQLPSPTRKGMPVWVWAGVGALVLLLAAGGLWMLRPDLLGGTSEPEASAAETSESSPEAAPVPAPLEEERVEVPPALRSYHEKAEKGDAAAMRMLGAMYYNGLNVPRNKREGLKWYRKAAEAGSSAAAKELRALEGKSPEK